MARESASISKGDLMKKQVIAVVLGMLTVVAGVLIAKISSTRGQTDLALKPAVEPVQHTKFKEYTLTGPYSHENLSVYLISGEDTFKGKPLLTLEEALRRKVVRVYETKDVNKLAIENVSRNEVVFVQAGDIVKGGQQDRVLSTDLLISARSGRVPIDAFCVEQGRWNKRGAESVETFALSNNSVATKDLKVAVNRSRSQAEVWKGVAKAQEKLKENTTVEVKSDASPSSLQLSLENKSVVESSSKYLQVLSGIVDANPKAIGYVFTVNGKVSSGDVYSSRALFLKLWPKLLNASAIEAVAELSGYDKSRASSVEVVQEFLADAEKGDGSERDVTKRTKVFVRDQPKAMFSETRDMANESGWIHRAYLSKQD
jgi:hypothetical protein